MGSVVKKVIFSKKVLTFIAIFFVYFVAGYVFFYFGLQPTISAKDTYAKEASVAETRLQIPEIELNVPVVSIGIKDNDLEVPEQIVGSYSAHHNKVLLIGHSSTAFSNLNKVKKENKIIYNDKVYVVNNIEQKEKTEISMKEILKAEKDDTIILMTCSGEQITETDYSHRLIITAAISS